MKNVFLDTELVEDFLTDTEPDSEFMARILTLTELKRLRVYVTPMTFCILYNRYHLHESHKGIIEKLRKLHSLVKIIKIGNSAVKQSLNSDFENFEKGVQYFALKNSKKMNAILTKNPGDYKKIKIPLFTPDLFLNSYSKDV